MCLHQISFTLASAQSQFIKMEVADLRTCGNLFKLITAAKYKADFKLTEILLSSLVYRY